MKKEEITAIFPDATEEQIASMQTQVGKVETERDSFKEQLETAKDSLKNFEGVNVQDMQAKITQLTADLTQKDKEYQDKIADMEFQSEIDKAVNASKARNATAVKALLNLDELKASKNQTEDIKKALEKVKADNDFLFASDEPVQNPVAPTTGKLPNQKMTLLEAMKYKNEHPEADVKTLISNVE